MFQRILVPLDGSALAENALTLAARLARASNGCVILLRVVSPPVEYANGSMFLNFTPTNTLEQVMETDMADARHYLECIVASSTLQGIHTQIEVHMGVAASLILSITEAQQCDVIVMSSHGRTGLERWLLGSIALKVVRSSTVPVLVLRNQETTAATDTKLHSYVERPLRVLVPLDGSEIAEAALRPSVQLITALAAAGEGTIHLMMAVKYTPQSGEILDATTRERLLHKAKAYLQSVTGHIRAAFTTEFHGIVTWSAVLDNDTAASIIRMAENGEDAEGAGTFGGCDFIALSTHGRKGLQRIAAGSVTERVLNGTRLPLLIVHPPDTITAYTTTGAQARQTESAQT
ncbi:MAG TPA: universal stress protein [Ktedonobacteraceae bacterium]|nr:universal stress protein [Ktedonobacteraceae bacterium]